MMSIWKVPLLSKADLTAEMSVAAPVGVPRSAWATQVRMLCFDWRSWAMASVEAWEEEEVKQRARLAPLVARCSAMARPMPVRGGLVSD